MKTYYTQEEWAEGLEDGNVVEIRHPYYEIEGEVRKVFDSKSEASMAIEFTVEDANGSEDAVYLDPLSEEMVCRELIEVAVENYIQYRVSQYRVKHADYIKQGLHPVVDRNYDDEGRVIGFRMSMDSDHHSHGLDETEGCWSS